MMMVHTAMEAGMLEKVKEKEAEEEETELTTGQRLRRQSDSDADPDSDSKRVRQLAGNAAWWMSHSHSRAPRWAAFFVRAWI